MAPHSLPSVSTKRPSSNPCAGRRRLRARQLAAGGREQGRDGRVDGAASGPSPAGASCRLALSGMHTSAHTSQLALAARSSGSPALRSRSCRDLHQMHRVLGVAVVDQRRNFEAMRRGPDNVPRRHAGRQRPGQFGRLSRISGVAPIGVPAIAYIEFESHPNRLSGRDGVDLADQSRFDVVAGDGRSGKRMGRGRCQSQGEEHPFQFAHTAYGTQ